MKKYKYLYVLKHRETKGFRTRTIEVFSDENRAVVEQEVKRLGVIYDPNYKIVKRKAGEL